MTWERIQTEITGKIGILTINYPPVNSMGYQTIKELGEGIESLQARQETKVLVVTGAGKFFVGGADINELRELTPATVGDFDALTSKVLGSIARSSKPVICAMNGTAVGGGLELALACDIRLVVEGAKLGFPEIKLGLMPGAGGTQRLPRIVGVGRAKELIFTGRLITAEEALRLGIVEKVVTPERLTEETLNLAETIAKMSAVAIRTIKTSIMEGIEMPLAEAIELDHKHFAFLMGTEDKAEGVAAFLEKRSPSFKDQ